MYNKLTYQNQRRYKSLSQGNLGGQLRRENLSKSSIYFWALLFLFFFLFSCTQKPTEEKPNILLIFTDQQNVKLMSAAGNKDVNTPAMDKIAKEGVMFMQGYCTSPVCGPARSSIISGRMPHETGVVWNGNPMKDGITTAGEILREAGYETVWGGKWHLPDSYPQRKRIEELKGFHMLPFHDHEIKNWMLGTETDPSLTKAVVNYINNYDNEKPLFLAVSYHNPHDICFYPRKDGWITPEDTMLEIRYYGFDYRLPDIVGKHPSEYSNLPELPDNFAVNENEPQFIQDKRNYHTEYGMETRLAYKEFDSLQWRGYVNTYNKLTEMVDSEIAQVMEALSAKGLDENTIVIFTSDHGDGAASHKWAAKNSLFEESSKIPFVMSWKGKIQPRVDNTHLVSQIDILPTLCDLIGIENTPKFTGQSMKPILEDSESDWRESVVVELADYKPDSTRKGRMLRTENFKYNVYSSGESNEQFFDIKNNPGETVNLIDNPEFKDEIERHRTLLEEWMEDTGDDFMK